MLSLIYKGWLFKACGELREEALLLTFEVPLRLFFEKPEQAPRTEARTVRANS